MRLFHSYFPRVKFTAKDPLLKSRYDTNQNGMMLDLNFHFNHLPKENDLFRLSWAQVNSLIYFAQS